MAFYAQPEYGHVVAYADAQDLVDVVHYGLDLNLRNPASHLAYTATIDMIAQQSNISAINFRVGEGLPAYEDARLKQQLRLKGARLGTAPIAAVQEDWEGGFTVYLPAPVQAGAHLTLAVDLDGNFFHGASDTFFPLSNDAWLPRHGDLDRATFDMTFHHLKRHKIASSGVRLSEAPDPTQPDGMTTKYQLAVPVPLVTFAVGQFERSTMMAEGEKGATPIPVEFNNVSSHVAQIRDDFILAEMSNALRFFTAIFGKYPYPVLNGCIHPYGFGQGFATLLMLAAADRADRNGFSFIAHETSHQWWGNIVAWRSYRDQWLSEGFAEYSGMLYTAAREGPKDEAELIRVARDALRLPPHTTVGVTSGRLEDIGPIILGHRLNTPKSAGAYTALIYSKGALVLRMLHFLLTNPSTGDEKSSAFYPMMTAFVDRYRNGMASTENFQSVASEYFAKTPIAQKYSLSNLDWFFDQWVDQAGLPAYTMEYALQDQADGTCVVAGTIHQDGVPASWVMPLPVTLTLGNGQTARTVVIAMGASTPFQLKLKGRPAKVELDPQSWVLSEKTTTKGK
jgi:aminopeptidase N